MSKVKINDNLNTRKQKKRYIEKMKNLKTAQAVYIYIYIYICEILEKNKVNNLPLFMIEKDRLLFR